MIVSAGIKRFVIVFSLGVLSALVPAPVKADSCPNTLERVGPSASLPDCRAYELVSPAIRGDNSLLEGVHGFPDGQHVYLESPLPLPGARNGDPEQGLSTRTGSGWVTTALTPSDGPGEPLGIFNEAVANVSDEAAFTSDFSAAFVNSPFEADPLAQDGVNNVYRVEIPSDASSLASLPESGPLTHSITDSFGVFLAGTSADGSHVLFQTQAHLPTAAGTPVDTHSSGDELYDRAGGHTYLVGVLPDGNVPSCGVELGDGAKSELGQGQYIYGAIAPDGANIVFKEGFGCSPAFPKIFVRVNNEKTVELSGTSYAGRSSDGTKIFTAGGNYQEGAVGVYEYDVATGQTTSISPEGWFVASSADGSKVYYWIKKGPNSGLYLWADGKVKVIGESKSAGEESAGEGFASEARERGQHLVQHDVAVATPDGSRLLFLDRAKLTDYNNFGPVCIEKAEPIPGNCAEVYVYSQTDESLVCVSCNPSGNPPTGNAHLLSKPNNNTDIAPYSEDEISPNGSRVFFETPDALVPWDTNGLRDVYEWEKKGTEDGSCRVGDGIANGGCIYLISSGQGSNGAYFAGAGDSGNDVFFVTTDHLAPQVQEDSLQIYDARVDGGFPSTPALDGCDSGECQGSQSVAPSFGVPSSAIFMGSGNRPLPGFARHAFSRKVKTKEKAKSKGKKTSKKRRKAARKTSRLLRGRPYHV